MNPQIHVGRSFEFSFPQLDTLLLVEEFPGEVLIRATRDTFSEARKLAFVRQLVSEGFISEEFRWATTTLHPRVRWLIDQRWLTLHPGVRATSQRFMNRLLAGSAIAWLTFMGLLFCLRGG